MKTSDWEDVHFSAHVNIKNIIGKELINNDNVAVMELVKNSYDAGAKKVIVEFKNLEKQDRLEHQLIISDDGIGMSKEDILQKWLNLAYSIKRVQNAQNGRLQAGNKGIGRFSCDRLGKKLDIYTKRDSKAFHLKINWEDFENEKDYSIQISQIPMQLREISDEDIYKKSSCKIKENGTVIKISYLRVKWIKFNEDSLFNEVLNYQKLVSLKSSLEKLINKSQVESGNFKIFLKALEIDDKKEDLYNKKINGEIKNKFFEKLDFNTTYIHSAISEDGKFIITKLKDRDKVIFQTVEKNIEFPKLKAVKIILMHLNPYGKAYFEKQMGIKSVHFGSIYFFINGFRIPPYGEIDNDSFGMEVRKNQGRNRYLSNRDIIGRIEIEDRDEQYKIISSREGIVKDESFKQLIHQSTKSKINQTKNNGFFYKTLRKLEKYVVDGLNWDSTSKDITETKIKEMIQQKNWSEDKELYILNRKAKLENISNKIFNIMSIDSRNIIDLNINSDLFAYLLEDDEIKTKRNIINFLNKLNQIPSYAISEKLEKDIKYVIKKINDKELTIKVKSVIDNVPQEIQELDKDKIYKQLDEKIIVLEQEQKKLKKELEQTEFEKKKKDEQIYLLQSLQTLDENELINLQHHIGLYAHDIEGILISFKRRYNKSKILDENNVFNLIDRLTLSNKKILAINKLVTKKGFLNDSEEKEDDLVKFIYEYIHDIYIVDDTKVNIQMNTHEIVYNTIYSPFEFTIVLDNLIQNAKKINKDKKILITINVAVNSGLLEIEFYDNGKGLAENIQDSSSVFNQGFTTTNGSGLGLNHVKDILDKYNFDICVDEKYIDGFKLLITSQEKV